MKLYFIVNPVAGKGKTLAIIPLIESICKENNIDFTVKVSSQKGDSILLAAEAVKNGYSRVIAVGGDGTVNEVLNGIVHTGATLGVIPAGSGNDFVRSIPVSSDINQSIYNMIYGIEKKVDLGICNERYFINVASVGLDTEVAARTQKTKKYFSGSLAYTLSALYTIFTYKGWNMQIKVDGNIIKVKTLLTAIANGKYYGGGVMPTPKAKIDDGYLDVCHISHMSKLKMFMVLPKYMKGKHTDLSEVTLTKGRNITINCDTSFPLNLDGEVFYVDKAEFSILEKSINVIMPENSL